MSKPSNNAAPMTAPITMPAIWPPLSPRWLADADVDEDAAVPDGEDVVDVVKRGCIDVNDGRVTPLQRVVTSDVTQHESVELIVLALQYAHNPSRLY